MSDPTIAPACTCTPVCPEESSGLEWDPECPEHRLADPCPSSSPDAVTVWCDECGGPSDVVDEFEEMRVGHAPTMVYVLALDCGHEEATPR